MVCIWQVKGANVAITASGREAVAEVVKTSAALFDVFKNHGSSRYPLLGGGNGWGDKMPGNDPKSMRAA